MVGLGGDSKLGSLLAALTIATTFGWLQYGGLQHLDLLTAGYGAEAEFSWSSVTPTKELVWHHCYVGYQCARLEVPLNYSDPAGRKAAIAITRKPAMVPPGLPFYKGPVLFNPGGPGGSGVDMILRAGQSLSSILGPQFDIVGFDPRGIGRSVPRASFFNTDAERALFGTGIRVVNNSDESVSRTWARAQITGKLAAELDDGYLTHINTDHTARDMLSIVQAHGQEKLQYWGFSYGSVLGATFASMFPDKVERLVIDGVVDSENYFATLWSNNLLDTDKTLESFFTKCTEAGPSRCPFYSAQPEDIHRNLSRLYEKVRAQPIPVRTENSYGLVDYAFLRNAVFRSLYAPYSQFLPLAGALAKLAMGDASATFEMLPLPSFECSCDASEREFAVVDDAQSAVLCNDGKEVPSSLDASEEYFKELAETSEWADVWAAIRIGCNGWPKMPKTHFQGPFIANTSHPILLVGNTADPVTPLWAAKKMSKGFEGSVVLTQDSPGHCSISAPSLCTQTHIRRYFTDGTLPDKGTICPVTPGFESPFPRQWPMASSDEAEEFQINMQLDDESRSILDAVERLSRTYTLPFLHL